MKQVCFGISTLVLLLVELAHGQVPFPGPCPPVKLVEDFKLADYMGVWYEYEKYPFLPEIGGKCMKATYSITGNDTISVVNSALNRFTGKYSETVGSATVIDSGALAVLFPRMKSTNITKANYQVLGTDYTSYAVVYSCSRLLRVAHTKLVWVLTREQNPPKDVIETAEAVISANNLKKVFLLRTKQTECNGKDDDADANGDGDGDGDVDATNSTAADPTMENLFTVET